MSEQLSNENISSINGHKGGFRGEVAALICGILFYREVVTLIWTAGVITALCPILGWSKYVYEGYLVSCSIDMISTGIGSELYVWFLLTVGWIGPNLLIFYCTCSIIASNRKNNEMMTELMIVSGSNTNSAKAFVRQRILEERRLWKVSMMNLVTWLVSWTPYAIIVAINVLGYEDMISPDVGMVPAVFCKLSASVNPFIYGFFLPKFKQEAKKVFWAHRVDAGIQPRRLSETRRQSSEKYEREDRRYTFPLETRC